VDELAAVGDPACGFDRRLSIVGMDEVDKGVAQEFPILVSESLAPGLIQDLEVAICAGKAEHVHGKVEEPIGG